MNIFKDLNEQEVKDFQKWARENYTVGEPINSLWHPVTWQECNLMNKEFAEKPKFNLILKPKQAAHRHCVHYFLNIGWCIYMEDLESDEPTDVMPMTTLTDYHRIIDDIECVDGGLDFFVKDPKDGKRYWFGLAIGYGNQPDETIHDYSVGEETDRWFNAFGKYWEAEDFDDSNHGVLEQ